MPATTTDKPLHLAEFPRYTDVGGACAALLARGCIDISWGQDACPSFANAEQTVRIFVDYADPADREDPDLQAQRFGISLLDDYGTVRDDVLATDDIADVFAYLDSHAARVLTWPLWMRTPIRSTAEAEACIRAMHDDGALFHLDDDPASIVETASGAPTFLREQVPYVSHRQQEIREHTDGDPHEYCVFLTMRPDSWWHLDDALARFCYSRLTREQRECLDDPTRREEALEMLDHLQARCLGQDGASFVDSVRNELDGDWR
jgi:hypothetical protein